MSGERDLARLLAGMRPEPQPGTFLFCTVPEGTPAPATALATFREAEATTVVLEERDAASAGLEGTFRAAWITLTVHSDLAAVGFLARVATALAEAGIACNAISAFHHDHLFVPVEARERALETLETLIREQAKS